MTNIIPRPIKEKGAKEVRSFWEFAFNKNLIELAVALLMANAIQNTVTSISNNLFMPIISYALKYTGDSWQDWKVSPVPGLTFGIGEVLGSFVSFITTALVMYIIYVKVMKETPDSLRS